MTKFSLPAAATRAIGRGLLVSEPNTLLTELELRSRAFAIFRRPAHAPTSRYIHGFSPDGAFYACVGPGHRVLMRVAGP